MLIEIVIIVMRVVPTIGRKVHCFVHAAGFRKYFEDLFLLYTLWESWKKLMKLKQTKEIIRSLQCHATKSGKMEVINN